MDIEFGQIPDRYFVDGVQLVDIRKAKIIPLKTRDGSGNDVVVVAATGGKDRVDRKVITDGFVYGNNKRIKMTGWKSDKWVVIKRSTQLPIKALLVPSDIVITLADGSSITNPLDYYVVCPDIGGTPDRDKVSILSRELFNKMIQRTSSILDNADNLEEYRNIKDRVSSDKSTEEQSKSSNKLEMFSRLLSQVDDSQVNVPRSAGQGRTSKINEASKNKDTGIENEDNDFKVIGGWDDYNYEMTPQAEYQETGYTKKDIKTHTITARLMRGDKLIGFIMENSIGQRDRYLKDEVIALARNKMITNAAVKNSNGKEVIYGLGVQLSKLQVEQV